MNKDQVLISVICLPTRRLIEHELVDLNTSDLCVLLCRSLFPPVVRDFAQKIPKVADWPGRNQKIWSIIRDYPSSCFRGSQSSEDGAMLKNIDNYLFKFAI